MVAMTRRGRRRWARGRRGRRKRRRREQKIRPLRWRHNRRFKSWHSMVEPGRISSDGINPRQTEGTVLPR